jgi:hypothetical protein
VSSEKKASKRRSKALPVFGAAGLSLSLVNVASATTDESTAGTPTRSTKVSQEIILGEEELADISLATFYVFDKENRLMWPSTRFAASARCGGCRGCGGAGRCGGRCAATQSQSSGTQSQSNTPAIKSRK